MNQIDSDRLKKIEKDIRDFYRNDIRFLEQFHDRGQA